MYVFSSAPEFDGRAENFVSFQQEVELWLLVTHLPTNRRAPTLALARNKIPRELCLSLGADELKSDEGADKISGVLRKNLAPDASDAAFRDIVAFFAVRRPHLTLDEYLARFEMSRRRAEARLPDNETFPNIALPPLRLQNAGLTPNQKSTI